MSFDSAIKVENLGKAYHIYGNPRDRLKQFIVPRICRLFGLHMRQYYRVFCALNDVSFEVNKGESIGIIGRNGSGKSTLLQLICGITSQTSGSIKTGGRIAALLELGSGFNAEFTGRENVYMNAAVLGLSKSEIDEKFEEIESFADIGEFIDQQVKVYSSGMLLRLAFSVAINIDPEILIVDEALAVGDELFQRKCFSRIELARKKGTTILFVSHSAEQVKQLCDRVILLESGEMLALGSPKTIVDLYQKLLYSSDDNMVELLSDIRLKSEVLDQDLLEEIDDKKNEYSDDNELSIEGYDGNLIADSQLTYASDGAVIEYPELTNLSAERINILLSGNRYIYKYTVTFEEHAENVRFGMSVKTVNGLQLGGFFSSSGIGESLQFVEVGSVLKIEFSFTCHLNPGVYFLNAGVYSTGNAGEKVMHRVVDALAFRVVRSDAGKSVGPVCLEVEFSVH